MTRREPTTSGGLTRWYVYETDGHRLVTWAATPEAARQKMIRAGAALSDVLYGTPARVEPAPPMGEPNR